jgi:hypothetical protein
VLKEVGLKRADLADPESRIAYAAYVGLIERAAMLLADPGYGLKLGASHDVRDNGLIGFLALNSPTLHDALANVERYVAVTNEGIDAIFEREGQGFALRFRETDASLRGLRHNSELAAAQVVTGARELTRKKAVPLRVEFMHGRPDANIDYERILGCPIRFDAEWDGVVYATETLQLPVIGADNRLLRVLEVACRKIIGRPPRRQDLVHSVREYVVHRLAKGSAPFDDVARHFNMSSNAGAEARRARGELSWPCRWRTVRSGQALPGRHQPAPSADRLPAGLFGAGALSPGVQAMGRLHAHTIPRPAALTSRNQAMGSAVKINDPGGPKSSKICRLRSVTVCRLQRR